METTSFGDYLTELRTKKNMSQRKLAEYAGLKNSTISRLEAGAVNPDPHTLEKIARALGVDKTVLFSKCGYIPEEFAVIARKTGDLTEDQKARVFDLFDKTIDDFLSSEEG
jgi:transcriptional regulator with XRE-family HTH domain